MKKLLSKIRHWLIKKLHAVPAETFAKCVPTDQSWDTVRIGQVKYKIVPVLSEYTMRRKDLVPLSEDERREVIVSELYQRMAKFIQNENIGTVQEIKDIKADCVKYKLILGVLKRID